MRLSDLLTRWPLFGFLASLSMLAAAHAFERVGGLSPCTLCLMQRDAYWIAAGISLAALVMARFSADRLSGKAMLALLAAAFGAGAVIAGFHAGVEQKWWPGLPSCAGVALPEGTDLIKALEGPSGAGGCDSIAWSMLGLSMAAWNMLVSLTLAALTVLALLATAPDLPFGKRAATGSSGEAGH